MIRPPPISPRTDTRCPYTTLFRSQHDLVEALVDQRPDPVDDKTGGGGARIATAKGDDAEGAAVVAAVLHLHERAGALGKAAEHRSEEHTSELQSLMRNPYAVFCLTKQQQQNYSPTQ